MYVRVNQTERSRPLSLAGLRVVWLLVNVCEVAFVVVVFVVVVCEVCGRDRCRVCVCVTVRARVCVNLRWLLVIVLCHSRFG